MRIGKCLNKQFYRWMLCLFIAAFFADVANIPDIFADQTIIVDHDDESISPLCYYFHSMLFPADQIRTINDASNIKNASRVIYDVDSVSLQAIAPYPCVFIRTLSDKRIAHVLSPFYAENLYLRNSSLLI